MKDSFVSNIEEILIANETQKNKIEFLERERVMRDHYLGDLQENLHLNKQTLKEMNNIGPNLAVIGKLEEEAGNLLSKIRSYFEQYQSINAVLLMQKQMRLQDKKFYNERMIQFENKIVDLRKYLHDKEDSFSSVVARLKKYQDLAENTMDDKLYNFKKEIGERHVNQFIAQILKEKSFYKRQYETMTKDFVVFQEMKEKIIAQYPQAQDMLQSYELTNKARLNELVSSIYRGKEILEDNERESKENRDKKRSKIDPNKELIRLLKKQKLSKELHEDALNEAIEKNEELISIKQIYQRSLEKLQKKCLLLYAENTIFALRLAEYDRHYCRYATHSKQYYEQGEILGLRVITKQRLKQYVRVVKQYFQSDIDLLKKFNQKLRGQVQQWQEFICDSQQVKRGIDKRKLMVRSCSVPSLLVGFQLDEMMEEDKMIIQQY